MKLVFLPKSLTRPTPPELARAWGLTLTDDGNHWVLELPDTWAVNQLGMVRDDKGELRFRVFAPAPATDAGEASAATWLVFTLYRLFEHKAARVDVIRGRATVKVYATEPVKWPGNGEGKLRSIPVVVEQQGNNLKFRKRAEHWLDLKYPEWRDPLAYWEKAKVEQ